MQIGWAIDCRGSGWSFWTLEYEQRFCEIGSTRPRGSCSQATRHTRIMMWAFMAFVHTIKCDQLCPSMLSTVRIWVLRCANCIYISTHSSLHLVFTKHVKASWTNPLAKDKFPPLGLLQFLKPLDFSERLAPPGWMGLLQPSPAGQLLDLSTPWSFERSHKQGIWPYLAMSSIPYWHTWHMRSRNGPILLQKKQDQD